MNEEKGFNKTVINWFPGHMAKARRQIEERIKMVDIIIELTDARAPISSKNPMFDEIIKNKPKLIIMTKKDLADEQITNQWIKHLTNQDTVAISCNLNKFNQYRYIIDKCREILKPKLDKEKAKGLKSRAIRAMVIGIPNVGKSTFINRLAKKNIAISGNRPGVTKSQQLIRVDKDFELFDTPGVLWPKFNDSITALNLALIGSIKQDILPIDDLTIYAVEYLVRNYPGLVENRYNLKVDLETDWIEKFYADVTKNRKLKLVRNNIDYDRVSKLILTDIYQGNLEHISWEKPNE